MAKISGIFWLLACTLVCQIPSARLDDNAIDRGQPVLRPENVGILSGKPVELPYARMVDGTVVPPFGYSLDNLYGTPFSWSKGHPRDHLAAWPEYPRTPDDRPPLAHGKWTGSPYRNPSGKRCIERINAWYQEGTAAGLTQDLFRSFDNGHSGIQPSAYPSLRIEAPVGQLSPVWENIFRPRVTMGVQSYGSAGNSLIEARSRTALRAFVATGKNQSNLQRYYAQFYENNFLFIAPAVHTVTPENDAFMFLSPYYLHSIGVSGSDSQLMKPLLFASASLEPALKTRILRAGLFVPTLMYLFKSQIVGDIMSPEAHVPAYSLPAEAQDDFDGPAPFLDSLIRSSHSLTHIPPVCRLRMREFVVEAEGKQGDDDEAFYECSTYSFAGSLKPGQAFVLTLDLRFSWTDRGRPLASYHSRVLRGEAAIEPLNEEKSVLRIRIPWQPMKERPHLRTDVLLLVHDGDYYSAPAYLSVHHEHERDAKAQGVKQEP